MPNQPPGNPKESKAPSTPGLTGRFIHFLRNERKYWIAPVIIVIVLIGLLILVNGSRVAPFLYPPS